MVIPASIRERAGLTPGSELEITEDELGVRLQRVAPGPKLVKIGRRMVARPSVAPRDRPVIDIEALIAARQVLTEALPGEAIYGLVPDAGLPKGFVPARQMTS